jgi:FkbM family methyltransferase
MQVDNVQGLKPNRIWLDQLSRVDSVAELRANLEAYYPGFDARATREIAVIGTATEGVRLLAICRKLGIRIVALCDDHPSKIGEQIGDQVIQSTASLADVDRATPIVIASHRVLGVVERMRALGFRTVLPFAALQLMAPDLFSPHMFYSGLLADLWANRDKYFKLNDELADQRSREVLNAVLGFRQTLDPVVLKSVLDDDDLYEPKGLIELSDHEIFVDGGSYDGDTIRTFIGRVGNRFRHVYAFEPDPATFDKLKHNFAAEPRVETIHSGLHRSKGILRFRDDGSRGAIFTTDGSIEMPVTTLDDVVGAGSVTYVKLNIEGAEIDALYGGEKAIRRERPKLALSVYHRPTDLWQIPEIVNKFSQGYDLYLRQHDGGIIETVLYALHKQ